MDLAHEKSKEVCGELLDVKESYKQAYKGHMECVQQVYEPYGLNDSFKKVMPNIQDAIECFSRSWYYGTTGDQALEGMDKCINDFEEKRTKKWQTILDKMN